MQADVRLNFFNIDRCGYYKHASNTPAFGSVNSLLMDLQSWSSGLALVSTKLLNSNASAMPVYLASIDSSGGNFLVTIWNEVPATAQGKVQSVAGASKVGAPAVSASAIKKGNIPGYPTFFLILPADNLIATLRIDQAVAGQGLFRDYLEEFLTSSSSNVVFQTMPNSGETSIVGYRASPSSTTNADLRPMFRTTLLQKKSNRLDLLNRADDITMLHQRLSLDLSVQTNRSIWQQGLKIIGFGSPNATPTKAKFHTSVSVQLAKSEVTSIINDWAGKTTGNEDYDIGFTLKGEQSPRWLSGSSARGQLKINVNLTPQGAFDTEHLLKRINARMADVMAMTT